MRLPDHPLVHEVFTWAWLDELSRVLGRPVDLGTIPAHVWDRIAGPGVDAVWLMGVWTRSEVGAAIARANPAMRAAHTAVLPDLRDDDVVGSAYCIRDYTVDPRLGGEDGLAVARRELAARGAGLVLDFVPNHVAPDHPWTVTNPEFFVHGTLDELDANPAAFIRVGDHVLACGRDPYFPAWPEVVQLATSRPDVRAAAAEVATSIAARCDAIRCDMAMLVLDDVHLRTWAERSTRPADDTGYWPTVFDAVRRTHPDVRFWAEAYWGLEQVLVEQGFHACYDKQLYDRLVEPCPAARVRDHLAGDPAWHATTVRFSENHDEPRLADVLPPDAGRAATVVALTAPGVALLHEGQERGRRIRVPVTLGRRPDESADGALVDWYDRLLSAVGTGMRRGEWSPVTVDGWWDNETARHLLAAVWIGEPSFLIVVNLSGERADGVVRTGFLGDGDVVLLDHTTGERYGRSSIATDGLYVALDAYDAHVFEVRAG